MDQLGDTYIPIEHERVRFCQTQIQTATDAIQKLIAQGVSVGFILPFNNGNIKFLYKNTILNVFNN